MGELCSAKHTAQNGQLAIASRTERPYDDDWRPLPVIGTTGSFGQLSVWQDPNSGRIIAVKVCKRLEVTPWLRERWETEVNIIQKLNHPNVVKAIKLPRQLKERLKTSLLPPIGMEFCIGGDLRKVLNLDGNLCGLEERAVRGILHDVCEGLTYLHNERIVHCDIKPENIVIHTGGGSHRVYKIIDFGCSMRLGQSRKPGDPVGTLPYRAPELSWQHYQICTYTLDYWSFGVLAFEIATGIRPFFHSKLPVKLVQYLSQKNDRHIWAAQTVRGIEFYAALPDWCTLSEVLKADLTNCLRWMLASNPDHRRPERGISSLQLMLTYLKRKVAHVLNTTRPSVVVTVSTDSKSNDLFDRTMVPAGARLLLAADGRELSLADVLKEGASHIEDGSIAAYLFNLGGRYELTVSELPVRVKRSLRRGSAALMTHEEQYWPWLYMRHYADQELRNCCRLQTAYHALQHYLGAMLEQCNTKMNQVSSTYNDLKQLAHMISEDYEYDARHTKELQHKAFDELRRVLLNGVNVDNGQIGKRLLDAAGRTEMLYTELGKLRDNSFCRTKCPEKLEALHRTIAEQFKDLRRRNIIERERMHSNLPMTCRVDEFRVECARVLKELGRHIVDALQVLKSARGTLSVIKTIEEDVDKHYMKLKLHHQARRRAVWNTITALMSSRGGSEVPGTNTASGTRAPERNVVTSLRESDTYQTAFSSVASIRNSEFVRTSGERQGRTKTPSWIVLH